MTDWMLSVKIYDNQLVILSSFKARCVPVLAGIDFDKIISDLQTLVWSCADEDTRRLTLFNLKQRQVSISLHCHPSCSHKNIFRYFEVLRWQYLDSVCHRLVSCSNQFNV